MHRAVLRPLAARRARWRPARRRRRRSGSSSWAPTAGSTRPTGRRPTPRSSAWYLRGDGRANTARGDGRLSAEAADARRARRLPLRPARPGSDDGRRHAQPERHARLEQRPVGPAAARGPARTCSSTRRPPLERPLDRHRPRRGRPLRLELGARHGLHREARRRPPERPGRDPRRRHPARCATGTRCRTRSRWNPAASRRSASRSAATANLFLAGHRVRLDVS